MIGGLHHRSLPFVRPVRNAVGWHVGEIAGRLNLSMKTVSCYRQSIKAKLGLNNGTALTRHAIHWAEVNAT